MKTRKTKADLLFKELEKKMRKEMEANKTEIESAMKEASQMMAKMIVDSMMNQSTPKEKLYETGISGEIISRKEINPEALEAFLKNEFGAVRAKLALTPKG